MALGGAQVVAYCPSLPTQSCAPAAAHEPWRGTCKVCVYGTSPEGAETPLWRGRTETEPFGA